MSDFPSKKRRLDSSRDVDGSTDHCSRCSNLPKSSMTRQFVDKRHHSIMEIRESQQELKSSRCRICQLLALLKPPSLDDSPDFLHAVSASWLFMRLKALQLSNLRLTDTTLLYIDSQKEQKEMEKRRLMGNLLAIEPTDGSSSILLPCRLEPRAVDYSQIQSWIRFCDENHLGDCKLEATAQAQSLKVIDCGSRELDTISMNEKYAALSYLWGKNEKLQSSGSIPMPQVVMDSIAVARDLGCDYLWVDRHCINQNHELKDEELERMDKIYSNAYFTIIAAAGEDPSDGLAGVALPREPQKRAQINGTQFSYLCTPPREKIRSTKWAERGWTYQEGFLSRRRIFFTNEQVIFQCNNMTCLESFSIPMKALHTPDGTKARRLPVLVDIEPLDISRQDIGGHIMEYSKRQLSHESDSLKAFMGILSFFKTKHSWSHFQGNPIHPEKRHLINSWYHPKPAIRRPRFPSWSWTGWERRLIFTSRDNPDYTLQLRTKTGELISVDEYAKLCGEPQQPDMEPVIQLTGKMMNVSFRPIDWASDAQDLYREGHDILGLENGMWAALPFTSDVLAYSFFYLDDESLEGKTGFTLPAMVLETGTHSQEKNSVVLVLRKKDGYYERAGLLRMINVSNPAAENKIWTADVQPVMYKDAYGRWSTCAPTCELERRIWLEEAKEKTIQLK